MINIIWKIQHCLLYGSLVGPEVEKEHNVLKWLKSLGLPIYPQEISFVKKFDRDLVGVKRSFIILKQSCTSGSGIQNSESRYWISQIPLNPQIELKPNLAELDFSLRYGGTQNLGLEFEKRGVNIKDFVDPESESTKLFILFKQDWRIDEKRWISSSPYSSGTYYWSSDSSLRQIWRISYWRLSKEC